MGVLPVGPVGHGGRGRSGRPRPPTRRLWAGAALVAVGWSLWSAGVGRRELVNPGGWTLVGRFWA
ncbi:MAG: hypothetical protein ABIS47_07640, partial [Acidimicrobiales bacterium]